MKMIRVIDLETCGFEPEPDGGGVCEIGFCDLYETPDLVGGTAWEVGAGHGKLIAPGRPVPPQASAVHHIVDADLSDAPAWPDGAALILRPDPVDDVEVVALAAHSAKMERQWCTDELTGGAAWICTYKAALRLWPDAPSHSTQSLRYWRQPIGLDRSIADRAHRAFEDAYVTAHLLRDMLNGLDPAVTVEQLIEWTGQPALQVTCHLGKYRGTPWREVDDGFLYWVSERDFDEDVLFTVRTEIERREAEYERERAEQEGPANAEPDDDRPDDQELPF